MPDDFSEIINNLPGNGWVKAMGLLVTRATIDEVACQWQVGEQHLQGYGIVHGGVHAGVIETLASIGAHLVATGRGQRVVGVETTRRSSARSGPASCAGWHGRSRAGGPRRPGWARFAT